MNITGTLPADIKALILQALRNPRYKQTKGSFELDGCYCAAGATMREAQTQGFLPMTDTLADLFDDEGSATDALDRLYMHDVEVGEFSLALLMFSMNDAGNTFEQIATHLEQEVFPYV